MEYHKPVTNVFLFTYQPCNWFSRNQGASYIHPCIHQNKVQESKYIPRLHHRHKHKRHCRQLVQDVHKIRSDGDKDRLFLVAPLQNNKTVFKSEIIGNNINFVKCKKYSFARWSKVQLQLYGLVAINKFLAVSRTKWK